MKRSKPVESRTVNLHGTFAPDGGHLEEQAAFFEFWLAAQARLTSLQNKALRRRKSEFTEFREFADKVGPIFRGVLRNEITPTEAGEKISLLVPDKKLRRKIFDYWAEIYQTTPEQREKNQQEIAREEQRLAQDERILTAGKTISHWVAELQKMAMAGDEKAAKALVQAAYLPGLAVMALEQKQDDMMKRIACGETIWPVLTDGKPGWEQKAAARVTRLNLGANLTAFRTKFRQPRGAEINLPARKWAKAAVRTIEDTRLRHLIFGGLLKEFASPEAMADFMMETGWDYGKTPEWVKDICKLGTLSAKSLPAWKRGIRAMIRQQLPKFHEREEWSTQRASAIARGRGTPGEIQNAILDDICSALERITPAGDLPKSTC